MSIKKILAEISNAIDNYQLAKNDLNYQLDYAANNEMESEIEHKIDILNAKIETLELVMARLEECTD